MQRAIGLALVLAGAAVAVLWLSGSFETLARWAASEQRTFQNGIARTLRALRGGDAGAYVLLLGSCFAYGFFHAIGPGHGKLLVGGYGVARAVPVVRLSVIALLSSLGQAITAIVLAYGGLWLLGWTRQAMVGAAEDWLAPASYAMIAAIGVWLIWRGARKIYATSKTSTHTHEGDGDTCSSCGHRHGPSQMGIPLAGIAGAFAMALGTASVTVSVGIAAAGFRGAMLQSLTQARLLVWIMPALEVAAGLTVLVLSGSLLFRAL